MSVLIKGIKKPASCAGCYMFLCGLTMDGHPWQECAVTERELDDPFGCGKPDWCQIVEIKEPHGRLIDASEKIGVQMYDDMTEDYYIAEMTIDDLLSHKGWVEADVPTIIPASEEGERCLYCSCCG